jgi:NAD(P)H-quinone oxidoreductase subunit 5
MAESTISLIILLSPLGFALVAVSSWLQGGSKPRQVILLSQLLSGVSLVVACVAGFYFAQYGMVESMLIGINDLGLSIRLDSLSLLLLVMIALLAVIIIRFSARYLEGDSRHGVFLGRLAATIASVQLLVLAGNMGLFFIAWVLTSLCLHRLLLFYPNRLGAQSAGQKKFISARLGDFFLLIGLALVYLHFGTGNLEVIFNKIVAADGFSLRLELAAVLIALTALLKSAQFPTHGWLIEVMETPTPVSALLHAGILNAGPFLIVRLSPVMDLATVSPIILVVFGGFTAVFASVVLLTQPAIKTALGYSSAAHMGFMLMVCGLGVYSAAMLHLVAHSFYKAHAFLSSGSAVEAAGAQKVKMPNRLGSASRIGFSFFLAVSIYAGFAYFTKVPVFQNPALLVIGIILVLGLSQIIAPATDAKIPWFSVLQGAGLACMVAIAFFSLEALAHALLAPVLPSESVPKPLTLMLAAAVVFVFAAVVALQIFGPTLKNSNLKKTVYVHVRNGLYANDWIDRLIGTYKY